MSSLKHVPILLACLTLVALSNGCVVHAPAPEVTYDATECEPAAPARTVAVSRAEYVSPCSSCNYYSCRCGSGYARAHPGAVLLGTGAVLGGYYAYKGLRKPLRRLNTSTRRHGRRFNKSTKRHGRRFNKSTKRHGRRFNKSVKRHGRRFNKSVKRHGRRFNKSVKKRSRRAGRSIKKRSRRAGRSIKRFFKKVF